MPDGVKGLFFKKFSCHNGIVFGKKYLGVKMSDVL